MQSRGGRDLELGHILRGSPAWNLRAFWSYSFGLTNRLKLYGETEIYITVTVMVYEKKQHCVRKQQDQQQKGSTEEKCE